VSGLPRVRADSVDLDPTRSVAVELCLFRLCDYTSADVRASSVQERDEAYRAHLRAEHREDLDRLAALSIHEPEAGVWVPCSLGTISATRPIGARVRFHAELRGHVEGLLLGLAPSDLSLVYYRIEVGTIDGYREYDLPLSHPLEVLRDRT
jgi:hypothetical protein